MTCCFIHGHSILLKQEHVEKEEVRHSRELLFYWVWRSQFAGEASFANSTHTSTLSKSLEIHITTCYLALSLHRQRGIHLSDRWTFTLNQHLCLCGHFAPQQQPSAVLFLLFHFYTWVLRGFCRSKEGHCCSHHLFSPDSQTCWHLPAPQLLHNNTVISGTRTMMVGKKTTTTKTHWMMSKIPKSFSQHMTFSEDNSPWADSCVSTW